MRPYVYVLWPIEAFGDYFHEAKSLMRKVLAAWFILRIGYRLDVRYSRDARYSTSESPLLRRESERYKLFSLIVGYVSIVPQFIVVYHRSTND
jgi:hypothetical protein